MSQTIKLKRSSQAGNVPTTAQLSLGEVAINTHDGKLFIKKDDGTASVIEVGSVPAGYNNTNWDTAYGWGDHSTEGYLTSHQDISGKADLSGATFTGNLVINNDDASITINDTSGNPTDQGVRIRAEAIDTELPNSEGIGIVFEGSPTNGSPDTTPAVITTGEFYANSNKKVFHTGNFTNNSSNWNTAYGWGNHASAGYLTSLPSHVHTIANVTGLQTALDGKVDDSQVLTNVPTGAVFTDTVYSHPSSHPATMITTTDEFAYSNSSNVQDVLDDLDQAIANVNAKDPVLTLTGDVTGSATFTNLGNATLTATVANNSHTHTVDNIGGLIEGTSFNGEYPSLFHIGGNRIFSDASMQFRGSDSRLTVDGIVNTPTYQVNGTTVIDSARNLTNIASISASGGISVSGYNTISSYAGDFEFITGSLTGNVTGNLTGNASTASRWANARTLSLTGDASGSVSWDGSANASLSVTVNNDSHTHDGRYYTESESNSLFMNTKRSAYDSDTFGTYTIAKDDGGFTGTKPSGSHNGVGVISLHTHTGNYYTQLHLDTNQNQLWIRSANNTGSYGGFAEIWASNNDGSGSGLDADLLDGQHASAFQPAGTYNTVIGTDSDINTSGSTIIDNIYVTDGVITSMGTRTLTAGDIGALTTSGKAADSNLLDGIDSGSFLRSDTTDYLNGIMYVRADIRNENAYRDHGVYGHYDSTKTNHIWSMGSAYRSSASGADFGNLYGLAYKHTNNSTGGTMAGGHQMVWCNNGTPKGAIGNDRVWHASNMRVGSSDVWHAGNDGSGSGLDADRLDGIQGSSFLRSDSTDLYSPARLDIGSSGSWDAVGYGNQTNLHFRDHNQFWIGAGNGTWFTGTANSKSQASGLAADATRAHDLLITTMQSTASYDRGITFGVDSNGAGTGGWRLGKWHSGDARDSSKLVVDGGLFVKGGYTDEYDYYADDYSTYYSFQGGGAYWTGDSGWNNPSATFSTAIQIQSGNAGTNAREPQLQFHQYGYGGVQFRYSGSSDRFYLESTSSNRFDWFRVKTDHGYIDIGPANSGTAHIYTDRGTFYFNKQLLVLGDTVWNAGNDGSGSGLDADLLDGQHASAFAPASHSHSYLPLSGGTVTGNIITSRLYVGDGNDGYFYSDSNGRTAFRSGDFYIQSSVGTYYNYATNQYHGNSSGDNHYFRGNALSGNNWTISTTGASNFSGGVTSGNYVTATGNITSNNGHIKSGSGGFYVSGNQIVNSSRDLLNIGNITCSGTNNTLGHINIQEDVSAPGFTFMEFKAYNTGTRLGSIYRSYGSMVYSTSSDYRLKENIVDLTDASAKIQALPVRRFNFIDHPDRTVDGFLAHEVAEVVPEAVLGEKDAVDANGKPEYQSIDQSKLVPLLTAGLQEALAEIENLKARLSALEN